MNMHPFLFFQFFGLNNSNPPSKLAIISVRVIPDNDCPTLNDLSILPSVPASSLIPLSTSINLPF